MSMLVRPASNSSTPPLPSSAPQRHASLSQLHSQHSSPKITHPPLASSLSLDTLPSLASVTSSSSSSATNTPSSSSSSSSAASLRLYRTKEEQTLVETFADLFALLQTLERIERAYVRDLIPSSSSASYTTICSRLINQYKTLRDTLGSKLPDLESFCLENSLQCPLAVTRLKQGMPATAFYGAIDATSTVTVSAPATLVLKITSSYITVLDALKLGRKAVDELSPFFADILQHLSQISDLPENHESRKYVRDWCSVLNARRAHEELTAEELRQCEYEINKAFEAFSRFLEDKGRGR